MEPKKLELGGIPAALYGAPSRHVWLFLHGQFGCKEEAAAFAEIVCPQGVQVLSIDLPGHGARQGRGEMFAPWTAAPELERVGRYLHENWETVSLRANSIGAYFAMLSLPEPARALLVSPVLDMEQLILGRMRDAGVTEDMLRERGEIPTPGGDTLSWAYLSFVRTHPVRGWRCPIRILYAGRDGLTSRETVDAFAARCGATVAVMEDGEHWFHTPEQLAAVRAWETENWRENDG